MHIDPSSTKYLVKARIQADGIVEKPDIIGAIFGQSEGLLGDELDLRDLQKSGRIGRIEVDVNSTKGKSEGEILIPSSLDQVETSILAAALETIERVGPCKAEIKVDSIEDTRMKKRNFIVDRARELLGRLVEENKEVGTGLLDSVRGAIQEEEIVSYGDDRLPAGPNVESSDSIIIVEGRSDVLNLLKYGIKNTIAVEGTSVPKSIQELSKEKTTIAFVDGDRGGELILKELLQVSEVDFIARAPKAHEVEELSQKQIVKALRNKIPAEQFIEMYSLDSGDKDSRGRKEDSKPRHDNRQDRNDRRDTRDDRHKQKRNDAPEEKKPEPKPESKPEPKDKSLSPEQKAFADHLKKLAGSREAVLLDDKGGVISKTPVSNIRDVINSNPKKFKTVVMDGIITQTLLDLVAEKGGGTVVGIKTGNVTKKPESVVVWTKDELA
ncbi:MAG: DNA primase DnaG [Candidatus Thermoplasmatota archaeon]|nr:DNA primase DnaG [Candidatus Thermoplasmatota archaeon]